MMPAGQRGQHVPVTPESLAGRPRGVGTAQDKGTRAVPDL